MWKLILAIIALWIVLTIASHFAAAALMNISDLQRFADRGIQTQGVVESKDAANHRLVTFRYDAGGNTYRGTGNGGAGNPEFDQIQVGQRLLVFYDREKPEDSILGNPQADVGRAEQMVWAITFAAPIFPTITIGSLMSVIFFGIRKKSVGNRT